MKYNINLTLNLPVGENGPLDREELLYYVLDAVSTWYGQMNPEEQLWELNKAEWRALTPTSKGPLVRDITRAR